MGLFRVDRLALMDLESAVGEFEEGGWQGIKRRRAFVAAARAVLDGREPDYEAALEMFDRMMDSGAEGADWNTEEYVHHVVDAALGGKQVRIIDMEEEGQK